MDAIDIDGLFRQYSLAEISRLVKDLEVQEDRTKQEVSQLVGKNYGRIIEAAESARQMQAVADRLKAQFQATLHFPEATSEPVRYERAIPPLLQVYELIKGRQFVEAARRNPRLAREEAEYFCRNYVKGNEIGLSEALQVLGWQWEDLIPLGIKAEHLLLAMQVCQVPQVELYGIIDRLWSPAKPYDFLRSLSEEALVYAVKKITGPGWKLLRQSVSASEGPDDPLFQAGLPVSDPVPAGQSLLYAVLLAKTDPPPVSEPLSWPLLS